MTEKDWALFKSVAVNWWSSCQSNACETWFNDAVWFVVDAIARGSECKVDVLVHIAVIAFVSVV